MMIMTCGRAACAAMTLASLMPAKATAQPSTATGVVFHDANSNARLDVNESGIEGVKVSNGLDVVVTDREGRWELPVTDDAIVFVIKPRGYRTPVDELHIPRFYYIHKPSGSADEGFIFEGVEPTGPLPRSIDFPLYKQDESGPFSVLLFSDPQPYDIQQVRYYATEVLADTSGTDAAFAISLGDLLGDDLDLFEPFNRAQASVGVPFYNVYGNHDMNFMSPNDEQADETFNAVFGPANYIFQYGMVHFIILDNVYWKGFDGFPEGRGPWTGYARSEKRGFPRTGNYEGRLTDAQLTFLENYLAHVPQHERVVICTHIPLEADDAGSVHQVPQLDRLMAMLSRFPNTLSFSGHTHLNRHWFFGSDRGYSNPQTDAHHHYNVGTASGSWWRGGKQANGIPHTLMADGTPNGYAVATFSGADYNLRFVAAGERGHHMRIIFPEELGAESLADTAVLSNVWAATGARSDVRMRVIAPGYVSAWRSLSFDPQIDPHYRDLQATEREMPNIGRAVPDPRESHNMFQGTLDFSLEPGLYTLEVEATDMFGNTVSNRRAFSVR